MWHSFAISRINSNTPLSQTLKKAYLNANEGEKGCYMDNFEPASFKAMHKFTNFTSLLPASNYLDTLYGRSICLLLIPFAVPTAFQAASGSPCL